MKADRAAENSKLLRAILSAVERLHDMQRLALRDGADSVQSFALKHGISKDLVYWEIAAGKLPARQVRGRTVITAEDGAQWRHSLPEVRPEKFRNGRRSGEQVTPIAPERARFLKHRTTPTRREGKTHREQGGAHGEVRNRSV